MTDPTEKPRTQIDPVIYRSLYELLGCLSNQYTSLQHAVDNLHEASMELGSAAGAQAAKATALTHLLDRLEPDDTFNPTEE